MCMCINETECQESAAGSRRLVLRPNLGASFSCMCGSHRTSSPRRGNDRPDPRRALGARGEEIACKHLERLGFAIVARNVRTRHGEIDAIAFDGVTLAFVEVKTRRACGSSASRGPGDRGNRAGPFAPLDGLRVAQRLRLRRLAAAWLQERPLTVRAEEIRFDAIGVLVDRADELIALDHLEGAW